MTTSVLRVKAKTVTDTNSNVILKSRKSTFADLIYIHQQAFRLALERLVQTPLTTLLTIVVIGIALALPALMFLFLDNIQQAASGLNPGSQMTIYLKNGTSEQSVNQILARLKNNSSIGQAHYISPEQGLNEFASQGGFGDLLANLPNNPLPGVIVLQPKVGSIKTSEYQNLQAMITKIPEVDTVRVDLLWVERLQSLIQLANRLTLAFSILLGGAVLLVIANTLRLMVQTHYQEIEVMKLIGATDRYVLRPFIYAGMLCGVLGSIIAFLFIIIFLVNIQAPLRALATSYHMPVLLQGLSFRHLVFLLLIGAGLGILSTQLSVRKHLLMIRPE